MDRDLATAQHQSSVRGDHDFSPKLECGDQGPDTEISEAASNSDTCESGTTSSPAHRARPAPIHSARTCCRVRVRRNICAGSDKLTVNLLARGNALGFEMQRLPLRVDMHLIVWTVTLHNAVRRAWLCRSLALASLYGLLGAAHRKIGGFHCN
jgi:hypothetical protein